MITKAIIKIAERAVKKSGQKDPELEKIKAEVNKNDTLDNCIYFDRFAKTLDRTKVV